MERRLYIKRRDGFTLVEMLFSLAIVLVIVTSISACYRLILHSQNVNNQNEDIYICAKQVSQYLLGSDYLSLGNEYSYENSNGETVRLYLNNQRLVKEPGFEILLTNIQSVSFEENQDLIYMTVTRNHKEYKFLVTYVRENMDDEDQENESLQE